MPSYQYLILGGGMTADAAAHGIREIDQAGSIGVLSSEPSTPYNRPPLSKGLWKGGKLEDVWRKTEAVAGLTIHLQTTVVQLDPAQKFVVDDRQTKYTYEKLLIATGGTPRRLPSGDNDSIIYFRTLSDYHKLRALAERGTASPWSVAVSSAPKLRLRFR
jgi:3-phenylpropionate/trans-cinnamate dioxygenase ferredoxin reductase component